MHLTLDSGASPCMASHLQSHPLLLGAGITGSTSAGISALNQGDKNFKELSAQIDTDLEHLWELR